MTDVPSRGAVTAAHPASQRPGPCPDLRAPAAQPTAPYLEAVTAYGFRGSLRFHVPGHKAGDGADPGLRAALGDRAFLLDVPQDIEGIDVGPSPTPYERAENLAADLYGRPEPGFSPTAPPRETTPCAWRSRRRTRRSSCSELARQPDRRAGAERRQGAGSWRPSTTRSSGWRTG